MTRGTEYLRAVDIVRLTGMPLRTVRRWIADAIIPSTKLGGARLVARADLERRLYSSTDLAEGADGSKQNMPVNQVDANYRESLAIIHIPCILC